MQLDEPGLPFLDGNKASRKLTRPARRLLTSVPTRAIPASILSRTLYSCQALRLLAICLCPAPSFVVAIPCKVGKRRLSGQDRVDRRALFTLCTPSFLQYQFVMRIRGKTPSERYTSWSLVLPVNTDGDAGGHAFPSMLFRNLDVYCQQHH